MHKKLIGGEKVKLEYSVQKKDQYGQALAYVYVKQGGEWINVNAELYENIHLTAYDVNQDEQYDRTYSKKQKQETRETILSSIEEMKEMLVDGGENKASEEDFPKIDSDNLCRHCRYRIVCKPGQAS